MRALKGIAASPGVAIGKLFVYSQPQLDIPTDAIDESRVEDEIAAFRSGVARAQRGIEALVERVRMEKGAALAEVFEGHIEILTDEALGEEIEALIRNARMCALAAIRDGIESQCEAFLALDDEYLRERADDLADIGRRLLYATAGVEFASLGEVPDGAIIVARDLAPSDTAQLDPKRIAGFAVETGGRTSHTAIMARTLELPAIVGCVGVVDAALTAQEIALDGQRGEVMLDPEPALREQFETRRTGWLEDRASMLALASLPATTLDAHRVMLGVNIGTPADAEAALAWHPDGVGLYRSEFLFMDRPTLPTEEQQFKAYASVLKFMKGKPVILRTLDIGGDKPVPAIAFPREENPFLGWRGIRMCLHADEGNQQILRTQLRAALRAAADGDLWIMYPMISSWEEVEAANALLAETASQLAAEGARFGSVRTGVMIETPGAAMIADKLAEVVDFFSIGSNDLTQYTLAADRGNERVARCYQPFHPAVWRMVASVIRAGRAAGIPVGMCGELAGIEEAALPLLGLGLDEYSMSAQSLPRIKRIIRSARMDEARSVADAVLEARTAEEAHAAAVTALGAVLKG
jgi:phosphotransferase system enzyme I (PtsI)